MGYIDTLESAFDAHFKWMAEDHDWKGPRTTSFPNGAITEYTAGHVVIRLVNERGLLDVEIGPASLPGRTFSIARYKEWLEPPPKGHWNLSFAEASRFLKANWNRLSHDLSPEFARATVEALPRVGDP